MEQQKPTPKEDQNQKLKESIKKFSDSYAALNANGKVLFENQILAQMKTMDKRTRHLYEALLESTKNGHGIDRIIKEMEKADRAAKHGI